MALTIFVILLFQLVTAMMCRRGVWTMTLNWWNWKLKLGLKKMVINAENYVLVVDYYIYSQKWILWIMIYIVNYLLNVYIILWINTDEFQETTGIKRIIQALHSHMWPNMVLKGELMVSVIRWNHDRYNTCNTNFVMNVNNWIFFKSSVSCFLSKGRNQRICLYLQNEFNNEIRRCKNTYYFYILLIQQLFGARSWKTKQVQK